MCLELLGLGCEVRAHIHAYPPRHPMPTQEVSTTHHSYCVFRTRMYWTFQLVIILNVLCHSGFQERLSRNPKVLTHCTPYAT